MKMCIVHFSFVNINVYAKFHLNIPLNSKDRAIFTFFQNLELGKASNDDKCNCQSLMLDLVNINVYAEVYQNSPNG